MRRFSFCDSFLEPISDKSMNETGYLLKQMTNFLDYADFDNEQLANVSHLMDAICLKNSVDYPISTKINTTLFRDSKKARCQAIDDAMNQMYPIFKRASANKTEKLDFSSILFYTNLTNKSMSSSYGLVDLINTSWISSNTTVEKVCSLTNKLKSFVSTKIASKPAQRRGLEQMPQQNKFVTSVRDLFSTFLDNFLWLQRRAYWESSTRLQQLIANFELGASSLANGARSIGGRLFRIASVANSTKVVVLPSQINSQNNNTTMLTY